MKYVFSLLILSVMWVFPSFCQDIKPERLTIPSIVSVVDHFHDKVILVPVDRRVMPADTLYHHQWNNYSIRYKSGEFAYVNNPLKVILENEGERKYVHPFKGRVLSCFGRRGRRMHTGIDVKLYRGDKVRCAFDGRVRLARRVRGYGNMVLVRHYNGLETLYAHFSKIKVKENQLVRAGDVLGLGGRTGRATTEHLHFETRLLGDPFDPQKCINFEKGTLKSDTLFYKDHRTQTTLLDLTPKKSDVKSASHAQYYRVRKGDTLTAIARKYNTSVKALCRRNKISSRKILKIGEMLRIDG